MHKYARFAAMLLVALLIAEQAVSDTVVIGSSLLERLPQHWRDDQGRDASLADFRGRRVYFTMAYATCRRVCPMTMARLQQLQHEVDASGQTAEFVIVGYDPVTDDPQAWRQYRRSRGLLRDNWHFLTGTPAGTEQFARYLGFRFWKYDRHVMHDYRVVLVDEHGELAAEYGPEGAQLADAPHAHHSPADE